MSGRHDPARYFETRDGHRECYCGHILREGETLEEHIANDPGGAA